jgi:hypothetical protein
VLNRVGDALAATARRAVAAISAGARAAVAALDRIVTDLRSLGQRMLSALGSMLSRAGQWLTDRMRGIVNGLIRAGGRILSFAGTVAKLLFVSGSKVLRGLGRAVEDPAAFLAPFGRQVGGWISSAPGKAQEYFQSQLAPLLGGGGTAAAGPAVQLKDVPAANPVSDVHKSAVTAYDKAARFGFHEVEVQIHARGKTVAQVGAEFARQGTAGGVYVDGVAVRRLVIWCTDGVFTPGPATAPVVAPAVRPQTGNGQEGADDREPAGVR